MKNLFFLDDMDMMKEDDPRTRPIVIGQETLIEIDRGQLGLGLSVVGGSDTQLVREEFFSSKYLFICILVRNNYS
jgi:hypothetical protein